MKIFHPSDGWRKTTEVHHRTEQSKYIGSIFNLAVNSDRDLFYEGVIAQLQETFSETQETHYSLRWKRFAVLRVENKYSDFAYVKYSVKGKIDQLVFYPGITFPIKNDQQLYLKEISGIILDSYNLTVDLRDKIRPRLLRKLILKKIKKVTYQGNGIDLKILVDRILGATWIIFQEVKTDAAERRLPHWFYLQKNSGFGVFTILCRQNDEYSCIDIWMQVSHVAMDGRAATKLQGKIVKKMGMNHDQKKFPEDFLLPENFTGFRVPHQNVFNGCGFVDFSAYLKYIGHFSTEYGKVLPVAVLIWDLASLSFFKGKKFNVPVDIPPGKGHDRTVGFVFTKPQYFIDRYKGKDAFRLYLENFNDQVKSVRSRSSANYYFLESSLMVPHWVLILMLRFMRPALYSLTGSICVTIIEGIQYGIPSLSDNIDSIISISLPIGQKSNTACISIRSSSDNAESIFSDIKAIAGIHNETA